MAKDIFTTEQGEPVVTSSNAFNYLIEGEKERAKAKTLQITGAGALVGGLVKAGVEKSVTEAAEEANRELVNPNTGYIGENQLMRGAELSYLMEQKSSLKMDDPKVKEFQQKIDTLTQAQAQNLLSPEQARVRVANEMRKWTAMFPGLSPEINKAAQSVTGVGGLDVRDIGEAYLNDRQAKEEKDAEEKENDLWVKRLSFDIADSPWFGNPEQARKDVKTGFFRQTAWFSQYKNISAAESEAERRAKANEAMGKSNKEGMIAARGLAIEKVKTEVGVVADASFQALIGKYAGGSLYDNGRFKSELLENSAFVSDLMNLANVTRAKLEDNFEDSIIPTQVIYGTNVPASEKATLAESWRKQNKELVDTIMRGDDAATVLKNFEDMSKMARILAETDKNVMDVLKEARTMLNDEILKQILDPRTTKEASANNPGHTVLIEEIRKSGSPVAEIFEKAVIARDKLIQSDGGSAEAANNPDFKGLPGGSNTGYKLALEKSRTTALGKTNADYTKPETEKEVLYYVKRAPVTSPNEFAELTAGGNVEALTKRYGGNRALAEQVINEATLGVGRYLNTPNTASDAISKIVAERNKGTPFVLKNDRYGIRLSDDSASRLSSDEKIRVTKRIDEVKMLVDAYNGWAAKAGYQPVDKFTAVKNALGGEPKPAKEVSLNPTMRKTGQQLREGATPLTSANKPGAVETTSITEWWK